MTNFIRTKQWLEYYILQQILGQKLHTTDDAASEYAVQLMDKLEATKAENTTNDAIVDDIAAKAYIENFALETFNRADESQRTHKVTKQTADTFMAAVTFMDVLSIFGQVEQEITSKSKFAKYHARRILQAIKAGEDPNASNPVVEEVEQPPQDSIDMELSAIESQQNGNQRGGYQQPSVESPGQPAAGNTFQEDQTALPSMPPQQNEYQVSPMDPPVEPNSRQNSIGGGYFPSAPSAPADLDMQDASSDPNPPPPENMDPKDFYNTAAPPPPEEPTAPSPEDLGISSPARPGRPTPDQMTAQPPAFPPVQSPPPAQSPPPPAQIRPRQIPHSTLATKPAPPGLFPQTSLPAQQAQPPPQPHQPPATTGFRTDDEATMAAQKHARWAISALNFEDVNTAVRELREALSSLGAG